MWVHLDLDLTAISLLLAGGASAALYAFVALGGLMVAAWTPRPHRALRVAAWSGGLAAFSGLFTASVGLLDPDADTVHALLWLWLAVFGCGIALVAWQGRKAS